MHTLAWGILALWLISLVTSASAAPFSTESKRLNAVCSRADKENIAATEKRLSARMQRVVAAYQKKDWAAHDKLTKDLLYAASQIPLKCLATLHANIVGIAKKHGIEPIASFAIDYGARLALVRTRLRARQFSEVRLLVRQSKWQYEGEWIYLRDASGKAFRGHSYETAKAIALLVFSDFGRDELLPTARTPGTLVSLLGAIQTCRESSNSSQRKTNKSVFGRVDTCEGLLTALRDRMPSGGGGGGDFSGLMSDMGRLTNSGFGMTEQCLAGLSSDPVREQTQRLDNYMQCRTAERQRQPGSSNGIVQKLADGYQGSDTFHRDAHGSRWEIRTNSGTSTFEHTEGKPAPGVFEDYYTSTETDSNGVKVYESNEKVTTDLNSGQVTTWSYEYKQNTSTGTTTVTEGTSIAGVGGVSTTTTTDAQGNATTSTTVTIEFDDGSTSTSTTTVDSNGNVTTTETSTPATTDDDDGNGATAAAGDPPPDEYMASNCTKLLWEDPRTSVPPSNRLGPRIIPAPDSPVANSLIGACAPKGGSKRQKCTSLMLCVEGQVDANCKCSGAPQPTGPLQGAKAGVCAATMCAEGASCDPNTGMCARTSSAGGGFEPPIGGVPFPPVSSTGKPRLATTIPRSRIDAGMAEGIRTIRTFRGRATACDPNTQIAPC